MIQNNENSRLFVIDSSNYLFRAYYAIRKMTNHKGASTNALFGFIRSIQKLIKDFNPTHLVCVFDGPDNKKGRKEIFEGYKAHRTGMPEDMFCQIEFAKNFLDYAGIAKVEVAGVEADDAIGSIAKWAEKHGIQAFLCSSDKDLCQLVSEDVFVLNTFKENLVINKDEVEKIYGITPSQIVDYLAIMGDASDNIPGVSGCGPKTAQEILKKHGSLTAVLERPEILDSKKLIEKFTLERENALMSQKLAQIDTDVEVPTDLKFYKIKSPNRDALIHFYQEMDFHTLLKEVSTQAPEKTEVKSEKRNYQLIEEKEDLEKLLALMKTKNEIVIDTETTSIEPMNAEVVGIAIGLSLDQIYYIPLNHKLDKKVILELLKPILENPNITFVGHNIKYDMHTLANMGIKLSAKCFDTMIASYLLNTESNRHNLDLLALEKFGFVKIPIESLIGKKGEISMVDVPVKMVSEYSCEDIEYTMKLKECFEKELKERSLLGVFHNIEMPLLPILFKMERHGIKVDLSVLENLSKEFRKVLDTLIANIYNLSGEEFNINSPKQLSHVLFDKLQIPPPGKKTQSGYSTNAEVLESLSGNYPIVDSILEYRTLEKLRSTYVDALPIEINSKTGRIHTTFHQSGTATGRLSSTNPNLQNIPIRKEEGRKIRKAFVAEEGYTFISADYSQIELRLLAHLSEDPHMIAAFKNNEDIHKACAAMVYDVDLSKVTDEMRSSAKAVNFGLIYGQQAFGLSKQLGISVKEASSFIDTYFKKYPTIKDFIESCKEKARREGSAKTLLGRERVLADINSKNGMLRSQAERLSVNAPIQGTQADIIKLAMIEIEKKFIEMNRRSNMILQIHDELIFETKDSDVESDAKLIKEIMEGIYPLKVPLRVDISFGKNWGEC
jgi:DNA polymerase-1